MVKSFVKKIASYFGFSVVRKSKKIKQEFVTYDAPLLVEFVGVSGVGKSTLYKNLKRTGMWIGQQQFIETHREALDHCQYENCDMHQKLAKYKLSTIVQNSYNPYDKLRALSYFYWVLKVDILVTTLNSNNILVCEEGLLHNFSDSITEMLKEGKNVNFRNFVSNKAIIYCYSTPEKIAGQIIERKENAGTLLPQHKNKSLHELVALQKTVLSQMTEFITCVKEYDLPIIEINTAEDMSENIEKINQFLKGLRN